MRARWTWKEGFQLALAGQLRSKNNLDLSYRMSGTERVGSLLLKPLYKIIDWVSDYIQKPFIIVLITLIVALVAIFAFYNIPAFVFLGKIFPSKLIRSLLFFYIELHLFGMGCRAFGRFNNPALIDLWKNDQLTPIFPGDGRN